MITSTQAKQEFQAIVKGKNFMTPRILGDYFQGDYAIELSKGEDFDHNDIFGVTVVNAETQTNEYDLSKACSSKKEALDYIQSL